MHASTLTFHQERILAVLLHIQRHLDEDLPLERLAKVAHLSAFHMHRIFKALVGEGVGEHVRRLRLERAAIRLKYGRDSILEVALDAGFESQEAFTRAFASLFGDTPGRFRRAHHERWFQPSPSGVHYDPNGDLAAFLPQLPGNVPNPGAVLVHRASVDVAFVRRTGEYHACAREAWEVLLSSLGLGREDWTEGKEALGICHDDASVTAEGRLRYDAAIPWQEGFRQGGDVGRTTLPGGAYLSCRVVAPALDHTTVWGVFLAWALQSPYRLRPCSSLERIHPDSTPWWCVMDLLLPIEDPDGT